MIPIVALDSEVEASQIQVRNLLSTNAKLIELSLGDMEKLITFAHDESKDHEWKALGTWTLIDGNDEVLRVCGNSVFECYTWTEG